MHVVKSLEIHGFRGQSKPIRLKIDRNANFLIGRNGTGKTTLINLINAALSLNVEKLRTHMWSKIVIKLRLDGATATPSLEISRSSDSQASLISFEFRPSSRSETLKFHFPARERNLVRNSSGRIVPVISRVREVQKSLNEQISGLYRLTWLSLARADEQVVEDDPWNEAEQVPDVDRKLRHSFTNLISYFSRLDGIVSDENRDFQKSWFLSFLSTASNFNTSKLKEIDLEDEERALRAIFQKFDMLPVTFEVQLTDYIGRLRSAITRKDQRVYESLEQIGVIYDAMRLHSLVQRWQSLQDAQVANYKPKSDFINVASDLLFQKKVVVNRSNQTVLVNKDGFPISIDNLSSGEKQLLIFLSETLLQEGMPHIFLADEPELSLHVEWQEELVPSLLKLNPNAQVIFATHSPDIVGRFQKNVINMEDLLQ